MEPIERELADRKERLKQLAIELQRLEDERPLGPLLSWDDHDRKIIELRYKLEHARFGIRELEEIIAEGSSPPKLSKPDTSRRRELSPEERQQIEDEARSDLMRRLPHSDKADIHVYVERITDLQGKPQIYVQVAAKSAHRRPGSHSAS